MNLTTEEEALLVLMLTTAADIMTKCNSPYHYCSGCFADGMHIVRAVVGYLEAKRKKEKK